MDFEELLAECDKLLQQEADRQAELLKEYFNKQDK